MTITVALSYGIRRMLSKESIYTLKLARRGRSLPQMLHANLHYLTQAAHVMKKRCKILSAHQTLEECARSGAISEQDSWVVVAEGGRIVGVISKAMLYDAFLQREASVVLAAIAQDNYITATETTSLYALLKGFFFQGASVALILDDEGEKTVASLRGIISREQIVDSMTGDIEMSSLWSE
jgi:CIC family chloride channel protein